MGLTQNLGRLSPSIFTDSSLNIGIGAAPSGTYKFEVTGTAKISGVATFGSTLSNGTYNYTLPSATGTLALTSAIPANPVGGTGTTNYLPKFTGTSTIGNSTMQDDGTNVSITGGFTANSFLRVFKNGSDSLGSGPFMALYNAGGTATIIQQLNASNGLDWWTTFGKLMTLTSTGNLGLGVTPSAWGIGKVFQLAAAGGAFHYGENQQLISGVNAYYDTSWKYGATGNATYYQQALGIHSWHTAPSGTAGAAITFTQAMTLDASGRLGIGAAPSYALDIYKSGGALRIYDTSNPSALATYSKDLGAIITSYYSASGSPFTRTMDIVSNADAGAESQMRFFTATSASNPAVAMTLTAAGRLLINTPTESTYQLDVNGTGRFSGNVAINGTIIGTDQTFGGTYRTFAFGTNSNGFNRIFAANDTSDGLYLNAATGRGIYFRVNGGGSNVVSIASTGDVGIGPSVGVYGKFTVDSSNQSYGIVALANDQTSARIRIKNTGTSGGDYAWVAGVNNVGNAGFSLLDITNAATRLLVTSGGNVLIGTTTNDSYKLDVNGTGRFSGAVGIGTSGAIGSYILAIEYGGSAAAVMTIKNSSASGYSGTHLLNSSGTLVAHFGYANASTGAPLTDKVYFGSIAAKDVVFTTNDTVKMTITSAGRLLLGTTTESTYKLDVNGTTRVTSTGGYGAGLVIQNTTATASNFSVLTLQANTDGYPIIEFKEGATQKWQIFNDYSDDSLNFYKMGTVAFTLLSLATSGAATFSSSVTATQGIFAAQNGNATDYNYLIFNNTESGYGDWNIHKKNSNDLAFGYGTSAGSSYTDAFMLAYGGVVQVANASGTLGTLVGSERLNVNGSIYAYGDVIASSDISVKNNIRPISNALDKVINSRGVVYDRTDTNDKDNIGFIAQELELQFPELVITGENGKKGVKYQNAVAVLFEAIKEQQLQIEELKTLIHGFTK